MRCGEHLSERPDVPLEGLPLALLQEMVVPHEGWRLMSFHPKGGRGQKQHPLISERKTNATAFGHQESQAPGQCSGRAKENR